MRCCIPYWFRTIIRGGGGPVDPPEPVFCYNYFTINDPSAFIGWTVGGTDLQTYRDAFNAAATGTEYIAQTNDSQTMLFWMILEQGVTPPSYTILDLLGDPVPINWTLGGCEPVCAEVSFDVDDPSDAGAARITVLGLEFLGSAGMGGSGPGGAFVYADPGYAAALYGAGSGISLNLIFGNSMGVDVSVVGNSVTITLTNIFVVPTSMISLEFGAAKETSFDYTEIPCT